MTRPIPVAPKLCLFRPNSPGKRAKHLMGLLAFGCLVAACNEQDTGGQAGTATPPGSVRLFNAASIARPLRVLADSFTAQTGIKVLQENQSSLELARKLTELGDIPDVLALADYRVFPTLLAPKFVESWYLFARNRMVVAYTDKSRHADELANDGWRRVLSRTDVEVGRSDPNTDPSGYRTLMVFQLAELHYGEPELAKKLLAAAADRNVRPREADQVGMLQAGSLDYIWTYENLAKGAGLKYVTLPSSVDLGSLGDSVTYAKVSVTVAGRKRGDSVTFAGEPILYGVAVPIAAADTSKGNRFVQFMLSSDGRRIMRNASLDALDSAVALGITHTKRVP